MNTFIHASICCSFVLSYIYTLVFPHGILKVLASGLEVLL